NLYLYTDSASPSSDANTLTLLNKDNEPSDGSEANLKGVLGMSDDGHTVYFVADGQLVSGADTTPANMIYRWHDGVLTYLGGMTDTQVDRENWVSFEVPSNVQPEREVTPDGQSLIVQTKQALDPVADTDTNADVYRWTVQSGQWTCLSCQAPGT